MSDSWDEYAEEWDNNTDVVMYSHSAYDTLCNEIDIEGKSILDFGCGTGLLTERMTPQAGRIVALDSSVRMVSVLKEKQLSSVDTLVGELSEQLIESSVLLQKEFDLIVASSVCAFLDDYETTLTLLRTLLKPDGIFVQWDWLKPDKNSDFGFTKERIKQALAETGFQTTSIQVPYSIQSNGTTMKVIMAVAKKSSTYN